MQALSFCADILAVQATGAEDLSGVADKHCTTIATAVPALRKIASSNMYKYAMPAGSTICAAQRKKGELSGQGEFALPFTSADDGVESIYDDGRGDDLSSPEAFLRLDYATLKACFGDELEFSDRLGVYVPCCLSRVCRCRYRCRYC